jgi:hypothetical protein
MVWDIAFAFCWNPDNATKLNAAHLAKGLPPLHNYSQMRTSCG